MLAWPPLCLLGARESVKPVPARSRFIIEAQSASSACQSLDHLAQSISATDANPQLPYLARTSSLGYRNSNCRLVHIESNVRDRTHLARLAGSILISLHVVRRAALGSRRNIQSGLRKVFGRCFRIDRKAPHLTRPNLGVCKPLVCLLLTKECRNRLDQMGPCR